MLSFQLLGLFTKLNNALSFILIFTFKFLFFLWLLFTWLIGILICWWLLFLSISSCNSTSNVCPWRCRLTYKADQIGHILLHLYARNLPALHSPSFLKVYSVILIQLRQTTSTRFFLLHQFPESLCFVYVSFKQHIAEVLQNPVWELASSNSEWSPFAFTETNGVELPCFSYLTLFIYSSIPPFLSYFLLDDCILLLFFSSILLKWIHHFCNL